MQFLSENHLNGFQIFGRFFKTEVIQNDTLEWGMYKFLFVFHYNYVSILYHFRDTQHQVIM